MIKKIILVFITLFLSASSFAQINSTSVYSYYGIGDKNSTYTIDQASMGGVGVNFSDGYHLNLSNPASNASLNFTNYALGFVSKYSFVKQHEEKQTASAKYLSYLALGFNLGKKGGMSFGLKPNTSVGYNLNSNNSDASGETTDVTNYKGEGGTNKLFLGFGYNIVKGLNIGVQGNYIFGKINTGIINRAVGTVLATKYETVSSISSFSINTGFQYKRKVGELLNIYAGGNFVLENEVESSEKEYLYSSQNLSIGSPSDDDIVNSGTGLLKNPVKSTVGLGLGVDYKWYIGVDYSFQNAQELIGSVYNNPYVKRDNYKKIALGGFYIPKQNSILKYWDRVTYRGGLHFEQSGLLIDSEKNGGEFEAVNNYGISFGVGLPVGVNQLSNLNLGFEFGKRGNTTSNLVEEQYFNLKLGISLNDKWFQKRKIY